MKQNRKEFIQQSSLGLLGMLMAPQLLQAEEKTKEAALVHAAEGETYWIGRRNSPLTIKVAKDRQGHALMSFCTEEIAPGEQVTVHKHLNEDELIFLHQGSGLLT